MNTDLTKAQLAAILSALDQRPRNPANRSEALKALAKSAERYGLTADEVLAAAPGLLDGRISPEDFRVELQDRDEAEDLGEVPFVEVTEAAQGATQAQESPLAEQEAPTPPRPRKRPLRSPHRRGLRRSSRTQSPASPAPRARAPSRR